MCEFCLVGGLKIGSVGRMEIFIFFYIANSSWSNLSPQPPRSNLLQHPPLPPIQISYDPLHSHSSYYIWFLTNQNRIWPFWVILLSDTFDMLMQHVQMSKNGHVTDERFIDGPSGSTDSPTTMSLHNKAMLPDGFAVSFRFAIKYCRMPSGNKSHDGRFED